VLRVVKLTAALLAVAFGASAVALAVERPQQQGTQSEQEDQAEQPEHVTTVTGVLTTDGKGFEIAGM